MKNKRILIDYTSNSVTYTEQLVDRDSVVGIATPLE